MTDVTPNRCGEPNRPSGRGGGQEYIISVRQKINRGRRLAEDFILEASAIGKASEKLEEDTANLISKFRDKYRTVMRQGLLDSAPDLDVLLLAKELEAGVVSSDIGIKKWSEKLGLRFVEASKFPRMLKEYLVLLGVKEPESSQKNLHQENPEL
jgi:RNA ligase partner protein